MDEQFFSKSHNHKLKTRSTKLLLPKIKGRIYTIAHTHTHTHTYTTLTFCRMYCKIPSTNSGTSDFACQRVTHYPMINLTKKHMLQFLCANLLHDIETALDK